MWSNRWQLGRSPCRCECWCLDLTKVRDLRLSFCFGYRCGFWVKWVVILFFVKKIISERKHLLNFLRSLQTTRGEFETKLINFCWFLLQAARPLLMNYIKDFPDEVRLKDEPCQLLDDWDIGRFLCWLPAPMRWQRSAYKEDHMFGSLAGVLWTAKIRISEWPNPGN